MAGIVMDVFIFMGISNIVSWIRSLYVALVNVVVAVVNDELHNDLYFLELEDKGKHLCGD